MYTMTRHKRFGEAFIVAVPEIMLTDNTASGILPFTVYPLPFQHNVQSAVFHIHVFFQVQAIHVAVARPAVNPVTPVSFIQAVSGKVLAEQ